MASYLVQSGKALSRLTAAGVATGVTLPTIPTAITLFGTSTAPCRATLFGTTLPFLIVVNGGTHDFYIDTNGTARTLQLSPPIAAPVPSAGSGLGYVGVYRVACTFKIKDTNGATIAESALGPISAPTASLTNTMIALAKIPVSNDGTVNARGMYITLAGGTTLYPWYDLDDNTTLSDQRTGTDAAESLLPTSATRFGAPPDLKLITTWKEILWGVPRLLPDHVRWTEPRLFYAWAQDNDLVVPPQNTDAVGVTAFIPRRDSLGISRRDHLYAVIGNSNNSFARVGISESLGCVSQESVVVIENTAYMLGVHSVNEWSDAGVANVSETQVDAWFNTDTYFNRSLFSSAQGRYNPDTDAYELLLASAGSIQLDRWVSYHLRTRTWYGPHKTDATTFTCAGTTAGMNGIIQDHNLLPLAVFGGADGYVYKRDRTVVTDAGTIVPLSVSLPPLSASEPGVLKYFDRPTLVSRAETQGQLMITPTVGDLNDPSGAILVADLTADRQVLDRLGAGRYCQLTITHNSLTEQPRIYGIEIPWFEIGHR